MVGTEQERLLIAELYDLYKNDINSLCMSILHNTSDAEDAVQDTFIRLINNLSVLNNCEKSKIKAYALIIARNICYDMIRKNKNITYCSDEKMFEGHDTQDEPDAILDVIAVQNNISKLTPVLKNIATLHFVEEFSPEEISAMLDVNVNSVYKSISRARKILTGKLKEV